jgi:Ca2+-dependent lipid-binding protein
MPGKVKVKIISGRNLPVMDRSSDTTDAYVEIKLASTTYKTDVCRKSLHPQWNSEWYRFEVKALSLFFAILNICFVQVDDSELQDEPLQIRLMDHDTYSANDAIGKVYLDLNPLLLPAASLLIKYGWNGDGNHEHPSNSVMSGWIPVYDTMHGIRGEVNIVVKVELFSDFNRFRQSSCGIQFFCCTIPQ